MAELHGHRVRRQRVDERGQVVQVAARRERRGELEQERAELAGLLERRYGLSSGEPMTLEAIGSEVGVTRERVRQIESRTLSKLKNSREAQKLKDDPA